MFHRDVAVAKELPEVLLLVDAITMNAGTEKQVPCTFAYHPSVTKQMQRISRKRDAFLRDTFYKYAHYICRLMKKRGLSYLIIGYNRGQKQGIDIGRRNNQSFVQVPFARLS